MADVGAECAIAAAAITLLGSILWVECAIYFVVAWSLGIVFQYFAIKPMRDLSAKQAILAAIKADTLSILAFQIGMYTWMAFVFFRLFPHPPDTYSANLLVDDASGYDLRLLYIPVPMNWWLIRAGLKERM